MLKQQVTRFMNWVASFFSKKKPAPVPVPTPVPAPTPPPTPAPAPTFIENFAVAIDPSKWTALDGSPVVGGSSTNRASMKASYCAIVNGMLCIKMVQTLNNDGTVTSVGGELNTNQFFGYGTYEFVMKASSDSADPNIAGNSVSGGITGAFSFLANSETEIDVEVEGIPSRSNIAALTSWHFDTKPNQTLPVPVSPEPHAEFHTYKYVWTSSSITFYIDGNQVAQFTGVVPSKPAQFCLNHYGTNDSSWGGSGTSGTRYMFVKSFSFTPL